MAFTVTDNSPSVGYIAWSGLNIQFDGASYAISDGNTNKKFVYWDKSASTTTLQTSDSLPTLLDEDVIVFLNKSGTAITIPHVKGVIEGELIVDGTILADAIATNAVTSDKIIGGAIIAEKIGGLQVTAGKLAAGAVIAGNIAADAVEAGNIDADAVTAREIETGTITANEIAAGTITADEIGTGAIVVSALADETDDYIAGHQGPNLVKNGYGQLGDNTNFSAFTYDTSENPGGPGGFVYGPTGDTSKFSDEFIPVKPDGVYKMEFDVRVVDADGAADTRYYGMTRAYDGDNSSISPYNWLSQAEGKLAEPLDPTDTTITLEDATGWEDGAAGHERSIRFHPYVGANGHVYKDATAGGVARHGYSKWPNSYEHWDENGITGDVITIQDGDADNQGLMLNPAGFIDFDGSSSQTWTREATDLNTATTTIKGRCCMQPNHNWNAGVTHFSVMGYLGDLCFFVALNGKLDFAIRDTNGYQNGFATSNDGADLGTKRRKWLGWEVDIASSTVYYYENLVQSENEEPSWDFSLDDNWDSLGSATDSFTTRVSEGTQIIGGRTATSNKANARVYRAGIQFDGVTVMDWRGEDGTTGATTCSDRTGGNNFAENGSATNVGLVKDGSWPAGTEVVNSKSGSTYDYIAGSYATAGAEWKHQVGYQGGTRDSPVGPAGTGWRPGTRKVTLGWLLSYNTPNGETPTWAIANAELKEVVADVLDGSVDGSALADDAVDTQHIADDAVQNAAIDTNAVNTDSIADDAVQNAQIDTNAVNTDSIADDAVDTAQIAPSAVDTTELATDAVTNAKIETNAVNTDSIANDAVDTAQIAPSAVDTTELATDAVTNAKIETNAVNTDSIANDAVDTAQIAPSAVDTTEIAPGAITTGKIFANAVTAAEIAGGTITAAELATNAVTAIKIAAGAVTAEKIAAWQMEVGQYIQSANYSAGSAGWKIDQGGTAEFQDVTARGTFKTAASGQRAELDNDSLDLFSGDANEGSPATVVAGNLGTGTAARHFIQLESPSHSGGETAGLTLYGGDDPVRDTDGPLAALEVGWKSISLDDDGVVTLEDSDPVSGDPSYDIRGQRARLHTNKRTTDYVGQSTSYASLNAPSGGFTLNYLEPGELLEFSFSGFWNGSATYKRVDVYSVNAGVYLCDGSGGVGYRSWMGDSGSPSVPGGSFWYEVVLADLTNIATNGTGDATFDFRYKCSTSTSSILYKPIVTQIIRHGLKYDA